MCAAIVENPVSSRTVAGVGARAAEGAAVFPTAGTVVSTGVCAASSAAVEAVLSRAATVDGGGLGVTVFLFGGRVGLAGTRVVVAREAAGAAAVPTACG
eukprot:5881888-Pleurochrysis_carterae.AAC.1